MKTLLILYDTIVKGDGRILVLTAAAILYFFSIKYYILSLASFALFFVHLLIRRSVPELFGWIFAGAAAFNIMLNGDFESWFFPLLSSVLSFIFIERVNIVEERVMDDGETLPRERIKVYNLTAGEFKKLVMELLKAMGYEVLSLKYESENGLDAVLGKDNKKIVVMVRRFKGSVSIKLVRRLFEYMLEEKADGGVFISVGGYSYNVYRFIEGKPVEILDGKDLSKLARDYLKLELDPRP